MLRSVVCNKSGVEVLERRRALGSSESEASFATPDRTGIALTGSPQVGAIATLIYIAVGEDADPPVGVFSPL